MPPVDQPTHSRRRDFRCWLPRAQALIAEAEAIRNGQPNPDQEPRPDRSISRSRRWPRTR
jgi:hypothetical protein